MLGQFEGQGLILIADFEAGLGTLMRLEGHPVDVVVVVVEPTMKSLEVGRRAADLVADGGLGRLVVTANRVHDEVDAARIAEAFPGLELVQVPEDAAIVEAERKGVGPLDAAPDAPAVRALVGLAERLLTSDRAEPPRPVRRDLPVE